MKEVQTMKCRWLVLAASLALCSISDCIAYGAEDLPDRGKSTTTEVRTKMGSPTEIRASDKGEEIWEYAGKPSPYQTYFLEFAKDGTLRHIKQVINDETFSKIKAGSSTKAEVRALLGTPWRTTNYGDCHAVDWQEVWEYRGQDTTGTYKLHVEFDDGGIARTVAKIPDKTRGREHRQSEHAS